MNWKTLTVLVIIFWSCSMANGQQPSKTEILRTVHFDSQDMVAVLRVFADDYGITIGLEADPRKPSSQITLHLHDVSFFQILDGIMRAEPVYRWRENNGGVDIFPVNGGLKLLDERIDTLQLKDADRELALNRLFNLSEVRAFLSSKNLRPRSPQQPSDRSKDEKLSFVLRGVTLRQALNRIAHDSGANFWVFRSYSDGTFEVSFS